MIDLLIAILGPVSAFSRWITIELRVANDVAKRARDEGIRVNQRRLRRHLFATHFVESISVRERRDELRASLADLTVGNAENSARLFALLEAAINTRSAPAKVSVAVGASLHERLDSIEGAVQGQATDELLWDARLSRLRPLRAATAEDVRRVWPRMPSLVGLLDTGDRRAILRSWSQRLPGFLDGAPADVYCWLGDLAADLGLESAATAYFDRALKLGAHPLGYWEIRRLWLEQGPDDPSLVPADIHHPLVRARNLELSGDLDRAAAAIRDWNPSTAVELVTRGVLLARIALHATEFDRAIDLALPLAREQGSPAGALIAARALIARDTTSDGSPVHSADLSDALELLLETRDAQRVWGYDTSAVVVLAVTAARLLNDPTRAMALATPPPDGEATEIEAAAPSVRAIYALMSAENGVLEPARLLLEQEGITPSLVLQLKGAVAAADGDSEAAIHYLSEALELVEEWDQKGQLAVKLATMGYLHPFVGDQLQVGNEEFAAELKLIAEAFGDAPGALQRLRAAAHSSARLSMILSQLYEAGGDTANQLRALTAAAERLNDANLWLVAAGIARRSGSDADAVDYAEHARSSAPQAWGAHEQALMILIESYAALREWDEATTHAALLVKARPEDETAIWTLITCQYHAGELAAALGTWITVARKQRPHRREHVTVWLGLCQEFGEAIASAEDFVAVAAQFPDDEEIRRFIVGLVLLPAAAGGGSQDADGLAGGERSELDATGELNQDNPGRVDGAKADPDDPRATLIRDYFRDFPDGQIRQFTVDLEEDAVGLLDQIAAHVGERPDTSEFDGQIFSGAFPLGVISLTHGATYSEAVVSHASGVRFARGDAENDRASALKSLDGRPVLDTTAAFALSALPIPSRTLLMAPFARLTVAAEQFRDAVQGLQAVNRFGHAGPNIGQWKGPVALRGHSAPANGTRSDRARIAALVGFMRPLPRASRVAGFPAQDAEDRFEDAAWFAAVAVAADEAPLWSDDRALNLIAAHFGVVTFTTLGLVDALESESRISTSDARDIRALLVAERYVGIPFEPDLYQLALDSHPAASVDLASVIECLDGVSADNVIRWMLTQAPSLLGDGHLLELWMSACVRYLVRVSPDEVSTTANLRLLSSRIARSIWVVPSSFGFIDRGFMDGLDGAVLDPLADGIDRAFQLLATRDRQMATRWLFDLLAGVDPLRRPVYLGILLRP
jgi:tetratricopeptide (TPR) repeat protein